MLTILKHNLVYLSIPLEFMRDNRKIYGSRRDVNYNRYLNDKIIFIVYTLYFSELHHVVIMTLDIY